MPDDLEAFVYDTVLADVTASRIRDGIEALLILELGTLGLDPVFADSFAALVLRVWTARQTGTAYLELRQDDARMRIVLHPDTPPPGRESADAGT